jgi:hypothetical protein
MKLLDTTEGLYDAETYRDEKDSSSLSRMA